MNAPIVRRFAHLVAGALAVSLCTVAMPALAAAPPAPTVAPSAVPSSPDQVAVQERSAKRVRNIGIGTFAIGFVMIGAGAGLEHKRRTDICKKTYGEDHSNACDESLRANISVLSMGAAMFVGGAVLTAIGVKRQRALRSERRVAFAPQVGRGFAGAALVGRF